jgi:hypothetical protein
MASEIMTEVSRKRKTPAGIGQVQKQLAQRHAGEQHHHVNRQELAAGPVGGAVVEPALRHDIEPGIGEPGDEAHGGPGERLDGGGVDQDRDRGQRGERREHPHVTDVHLDPGRQGGTGEKADEIARHHQAGDGGPETLGDRANAEQTSLQAVAQHQHAHAEQQRPGACNRFDHDRDRSRLA